MLAVHFVEIGVRARRTDDLLSSQGVIMVMSDPIQGGKWMRADARRTDDRFLSQTEWKSELGT